MEQAHVLAFALGYLVSPLGWWIAGRVSAAALPPPPADPPSASAQ